MTIINFDKVIGKEFKCQFLSLYVAFFLDVENISSIRFKSIVNSANWRILIFLEKSLMSFKCRRNKIN